MGRKTILFVDDDEDDRQVLKSEMIGYSGNLLEVVEAENGAKAIDYLRTTQDDNVPCLIILDLNMPVMDGRKTFETIRHEEKFKNIPLIVYTSGSNPADRDYFQKCGVKYEVKPMSLDKVRELARSFVGTCNGTQTI